MNADNGQKPATKIPTLFPPDPAPAALGLACAGCGATEIRTWWQTFANGTKHVRAECARCGRFLRYLRTDNAS
jgi:hypothetical protein